MIDRGNLIDSRQQVIQNRIMIVLGLLKSGKVRLRRTIDRGNRIELLGMRCNKFCPHHGDALLDGNAHSVRYGEIYHDRWGQLHSANYQEEPDSEAFVMGSDAAEFVNELKDQVRKRQKGMSNVADSGEEHSIIWDCSWLRRWMRRHSWDSISWITKTPSRIPQILPWRKCSTSQRSWEANRKRLIMWTKFIGKIIHGNSCHWLVSKPLSIFNAQKSTSSQILCCGKFHQHPESDFAFKTKKTCFCEPIKG